MGGRFLTALAAVAPAAVAPAAVAPALVAPAAVALAPVAPGAAVPAAATFAGAGQEPSPEERAQLERELRAAQAAHALTVLSERQRAFLDAWAEADAPARARAARVLEKMRPSGAGVASGPSLPALTRALRAFEEEGDGPGPSPVQEIAGALDLRPVPGVFAPPGEELGEPVTVAVVPLHAPERPRDVQLTLWWIPPEGERVRARSEPFAASDLRPPGFPMYLRAPQGGPGPWRLVPEVESGGERALGLPVLVEAVPRFRERLRAAAQSVEDPDGPLAMRVDALAKLAAFGLRTTLLPPSRLLLAPPKDAGAQAGPLPIERAFEDAAGAAHWVWLLGTAGGAKRTVLLLAPRTELPETALFGAGEEGWRRAAEATRSEVLASHLPSSSETDVAAWLARLRARTGELAVVARGETAGRLQLELLGAGELPFDALVASTVVSADPRDVLAPVPRLWIAPGGAATLAEPSGAPPPDFQWIDGARIPLLNEPELPDIVARWLEPLD